MAVAENESWEYECKVTYGQSIPSKAGDTILRGLDLFGNPILMKIELNCLGRTNKQEGA